MSTRVGPGGGADGVGGGSANVGGELRQRDEGPGVGLYISSALADPSWHIRGVERQLEEAAAEARLTIPGADGASLSLLLPLDYALGDPETLNTQTVIPVVHDAVRAAVRASAASGPLTLTEDTAGFGTISFTAAAGDPLKNAFARVATSGGSLDITRPDLAVRARGTWPTPTVGIQVEYVAYGTVGNGFRILIQGALDSTQTENYTVAAAYTSDTRMTVTITFNSAASTNVAYSDIAAAINLARRNNNQLVAAVTQPGSATGTASQSSNSGSDVTLSGGGMFPGARTNVGHVEAHHTGPRVEGEAGAAASGTYDNKLKLTANTPGAYGNIRVVFEDWATSGSGITVAQEGASRINVAFRNPFGSSNDDTTFTLASIKEAIEGFTGSGIPTFTVSYVGGATGTDTITRAASGAGDHFWDTTLTGGVDPVAAENQLRATWDEGSGILAIYALPTDPMVDVAAAILALDEFAAADLEYSTGSTPNTDVLTFSGADAGQHHDYAFANGTDKSVLALAGDPIEFPSFYTFGVNGVVPEVTTAQELVDFINGLDGPDDFVTASVTSGESGTDTFDTGAISIDVAGGDAGQPAIDMSVVLAQAEIEVTIQTGRSLQSIASPTQYWRDEDGTPTAVTYPLDERDAAPATHTAIGILFTETNPTRPSTTISFSWATDGETGDTPQFTDLIDFPNFKSMGVTGIIPGVTTVQDIITLFNAAGNEAFLGFITPSIASGAQGSDTIPAGNGSFDFTTGLPGEPTGNRIETGDQTAVIATLPDPFRPTGGRNYVPPTPIEALVRTEDEADGENIEVRYHATDTLRDIFEALEAQGAVTVVEIYGTSLGDFPEEPPFERAMYPEGGSVEGGDGGLTQVSSDGTLAGRGTSGSPLRVARPFSQGDESHLDALPPLWAAGVHAVGDQVSWAGKVYRCIATRAVTDTGNPATDTTGWAEVGTGGGDGDGLTAVATDSTITGDGTPGDPLAVANPFSNGMENKVTNLPDIWHAKVWAVGDQCLWGVHIYQCDVARLETDTTQPQSDPAWRRVGDLADIATDATITGDGKSATPLAVANPFTDDDESHLDGLPPLWAAGTHAVGSQRTWAGIIYRCLVARTSADTDNPATDTTGWLSVGPGDATETAKGVIEIADDDEGDGGTDNSRAMTAAGVRRQVGPPVSNAERTSTSPQTSVRRFSPADIVAMIAAHGTAAGLTRNEVDARIRALVAAVALMGDSDRWPKNKLPTDIVDTAALNAAIADFVASGTITSQRTAAIQAAIDALVFIADGGAYDETEAYAVRTVVRHEGATYLSLQAVSANTAATTEPGAGTDWEDYWDRLGYEDGPPNALVNVSREDRTLTFSREDPDRAPVIVTFPPGNESAYAFRAAPTLDLSAAFDSTQQGISDRDIAANSDAGAEFTILDAESFEQAVQADNDFITEWFGSVDIDLNKGASDDLSGLVELIMETTHAFNGKTLVHRRVHTERSAGNNQQLAIPLNVFNRRSRVSTGTYRAQDGSDVEITEADLQGSVDISYKLIVRHTDNAGTRKAFRLDVFRFVNQPAVVSYQLGAFEQLVESAARAESIAFADLADGSALAELLADVGAATVVHGSGAPEIITGVTSGSADFTIKAGAYLLELAGMFDGSQDNARAGFTIRRASDDTELTAESGLITPDSGSAFPASIKELLFLSADTEVNLAVNRQQGIAITDPVLTVVPLGGDKGDKGDPGIVAFAPTDLGTATFNLSGSATGVALTDSGDAIVCPDSGYILAIRNIPALDLVGDIAWMLAADLQDADAANPLASGFYTNNANAIFYHAAAQSGGASTGNEIIVQHIGTTTDESGGAKILPSIARFDITSGEARPAAGSIAGDRYGYELAISQSAHVGAARIVGFAGTEANPSIVAVLAPIDPANYHHDTGEVTIPQGVSLAAGDIYTLRLEVYPTGTSTSQAPTIYHDFRITAQAPTELVHFGWLGATEGSVEDEDDVVFATNDIGDPRGSVAGTWNTDVPEDGADYRLYWAVPEDLTQPSSWTTSGFDITSGIDDRTSPPQRTIGGVTYNFYLTEADGPYDDSSNGTPIVVA